jgi:hypothetical protein
MSWSSVVHRRDGTLLGAAPALKMQQGEIIECITAGGGVRRPLARRRAKWPNVRDGFVSRSRRRLRRRAHRRGGSGRDGATERLRATKARGAGEINWTFRSPRARRS